MARADWPIVGESNKIERSNVMITITDNAGVVEGGEVVAVCNRKTFTSTLKNGVAKLYTTEVGTYTITIGEYSTMLVCPYFGMFSTDIYSGTLKVTCIEAGGNGKSCHVQSCDDNYEFTDDYNLTQTFDTSLELTFMGIPTGKYLITLNEKYRFFKEIISIQKINTQDVDLKQYLYKSGDICVHNTGGWKTCKVQGVTETKTAGKNTTTSTAVQAIKFLESKIQIYQKCVAPQANYGWVAEWGITAYMRPNVGSYVYCGTVKPLSIPISMYTQMTINKNANLPLSIRAGEENNNNTTTATPTVLISGNGDCYELSQDTSNCYIVMGNQVYRSGTIDNINVTATYTYEFTCDVTEIYLV